MPFQVAYKLIDAFTQLPPAKAKSDFATGEEGGLELRDGVGRVMEK